MASIKDTGYFEHQCECGSLITGNDLQKIMNHCGTAVHRKKMNKLKNSKPIKETCECGYAFITLNPASINNHIKSKSHLHNTMLKEKRLTEEEYRDMQRKEKRDSVINNKIDNFSKYKESLKSCSRCLKVGVPPEYYNIEKDLCLCCEEILIGGTKICTRCKREKDINTFERPYLIKCKECAANRARRRILCVCGDYTTLASKSKHIKSNKHSMKINYIKNHKDKEQNEEENEEDEEVIIDSPFC